MPPREVVELLAHRSQDSLRTRVTRLRALLPTLVLATVAATGAWIIARAVFGTTGAFFAPVAAIITLGLTAGQRLERGIELSVGVPLGIALADVLVLELGSGAPQLLGVTFVAMAAAVLVGGGPLLTTQAAVSAILVVTLQPPTDGLNFSRAADALIGCSVALLMNFVIWPINPLDLVLRQAEPVLRELAGVLDDIALALEHRDAHRAEDALVRARSVDGHARGLLDALEVGRETAMAAPPRRGARAPLERLTATGAQLDLAVRDTRVLARAAMRALDIEDHVPPDVPIAIRELGEAVGELRPWMDDPSRTEAARRPAVAAARRASATLEQTHNLSVSVIVGQVRSTAVDLLRSTGVSADDARAMVRGSVVG